MLTIEQRITEARALFTEGRICRGDWRKTEEDGREMACLLGAFGADIKSAGDCPGEIMPAWAAHLSVAFDDRTSDEAWPGIMRRYGDAATRWQSLSEAAWRRVLLKTLDASLVGLEPHSEGSSVKSVRGLIARELAAAAPAKAEWFAAADAPAAFAVVWAERAEAEASGAAAWDKIADAFLHAVETELVT